MIARLALLLVGLTILAGCTPMGYIKSGATDEQVKQDLTDCTEIARHQAFRDQPSLEFQLGLGYGPVHRRDRSLFARHRPSYAEVQHRYRRVCMIARAATNSLPWRIKNSEALRKVGHTKHNAEGSIL